jgi:hypothetical protein
MPRWRRQSKRRRRLTTPPSIAPTAPETAREDRILRKALYRIVVQGKANWRCACNKLHPLNRYRCKHCRMQAPHRRADLERAKAEIECDA